MNCSWLLERGLIYSITCLITTMLHAAPNLEKKTMTDSMLKQEYQKDEYGIILLPDNNGANEVRTLTTQLEKCFQNSEVTFSTIHNIPHVSLFQGVFDKNGLEILKQEIQKLSKIYHQVTIAPDPILQDTQENIFLNFINNHDIEEIAKNFFEQRIYEKRSQDRLMKQVERDLKNGVSEQNAELIKQYGLYWNIPGKLNPHFTLIYGTYTNPKIQSILFKIPVSKNAIKLTQIAIARLGFEGNVVEVLYSFPLKTNKK